MCFFAFQVPVATIAAYSFEYRRHTGRSQAIGSVAAQSQAALNATRHARVSVIVLTAGVAVVICPQMVNSGDDASPSEATTP